MIPLYDSNPTRNFPIVTVSIIAATVAIFFLHVTSGNFNLYIFRYGAIPSELTGFIDREPYIPYPVHLTAVTSLFLHGGLFHLAGNMLFLWIFGNNVEDIFGRIPFAVYFLLCGIGATAAHAIQFSSSDIPLVGASGAISGLMAAYLIAFPHAKVHVLFWFFIFIKVIPFPAWLVITIWFLVQLLNFGAPGAPTQIAWGAHVGGFIVGLILYPPFIVYARFRGAS
jgi:membrane associated rhomboid family serine protease